MKRINHILFALIACLSSTALLAAPDLAAILSRKAPPPGYLEVAKAITAGADINNGEEEGPSPLMVALANGVDIMIIKALINSGADVNFKYADISLIGLAARFYATKDVLEILIEAGSRIDNRVLRHAVSLGNIEAVKYLIEKSEARYFLDDKGMSLLHFAAADNQDPEVIRFLLKKGFSASHTDIFKQTPLTFCARSTKNPEILKTLVHAGAKINHRSEGGRTPLIWAIRSLNVGQEVALALIEMGADVNLADDDGKTPLMLASRDKEKLEIVKALLKAGARADVKDKSGLTALDYGITEGGDIKIVELILNQHKFRRIAADRLNQAMFLAVDAGDREMLVQLLKMGANPNALNDQGGNPLRAAAFLDQKPEIFNVLIQAGARLNFINKDGMTAMHWAAANSSFPLVIDILASAGELVDVKETDADMTPLMFACFGNRNEKVVEALIKHGANVNAIDSHGRSPLAIAAASFSNTEVIKTLLKHGAEPNFVTSDGKTITDLINENKEFSAEDKAKLVKIYFNK